MTRTTIMNAALPIEPASGARTTSTVLVAVFLGAMIMIYGVRPWGFVHHDTSEVVMWGLSGWTGGFWKHPPFLPWLTRLWTTVFSISSFSLALLTALNMTVSAWAVGQIAGLARTEPSAQPAHLSTVAIVLLACVPYASVMAIKLNHNSILISLWPLTTLALLRALDRPTALRGLLFAMAAAAAVLAKYYSLLLLASCFAASLATPARAKRFYRGPAPYVTAAVFSLALAPHLWWLFSQPASPLSYAFKGGSGPLPIGIRGWPMALSFALQTPFLLVPMAIVTAPLWRFRRTSPPAATRHRFEREILVMTVVPYILTMIVVAAFNLRGPVAWAMPVFLCVPAIIAARVGTLQLGSTRQLAVAAAIVLAFLAVAGQAGVRLAIARGADGVSEPRREIAEAATQLWRSATNSPLPLVAGDARLTSAAVIFSADHPQAWPNFDTGQAPWIELATVEKTGFVALCRARDAGCLDAAVRIGGANVLRCQLRKRVSYLGATGPWFETTLFLVPPTAAGPHPTKLSCPAN